MLLNKPLSAGDLNGIIYDFTKAGDILPTHIHNESNVHITIVCKGSIKTYSHDWEKEATAGQVVDFRVGEPHEIMALEDNTRIINIVKKFGGISNDYIKE
jgi:quercetin dioxygenase-like cupin family protein